MHFTWTRPFYVFGFKQQYAPTHNKCILFVESKFPLKKNERTEAMQREGVYIARCTWLEKRRGIFHNSVKRAQMVAPIALPVGLKTSERNTVHAKGAHLQFL